MKDHRVVREASEHQAYIVNMKEHGDTMAVEMEKLNICKKEQEETTEMKIFYL